MIRSKLLIVLIALTQTYLAHATSTTADSEKEVLASFQSLIDASMNLDAEAYFQHFDADKFVGLNSNGTNWNSLTDFAPVVTIGFDSIQEVISLEFPNVKVSIIDQYTAVLVNEFSQSVLLKNNATITVSGGGTQVWSKRSGDWKLVSVSASNKPTPTAHDEKSQN